MIYFIKHTEYVKIGFTNDINNRLSQLQVSSPIKLFILGLIEGTVEDEYMYHLKFKNLHCHGEWFKYTDEINKFIETLNRDLMWKYGFDEQESSEFDEIESYFQFVSTAVENSPTARPSKIKALKDIQKNTRNINDIYPAKSLADKKSLRKMLFIDSNVFQDS